MKLSWVLNTFFKNRISSFKDERDATVTTTTICSIFLAAIIFFIFGTYYRLSLNAHYIQYSNYILTSILLCTLYLYTKNFSHQLIANFAIFITYFGIMNVHMCIEREMTAGLYTLLTIPFGAGFLLRDRKYVLIWGGMIILSYPILSILGPMFFDPLYISISDEFRSEMWMVNYYMTSAVMTGLIFVYAGVSERSFQLARKKSDQAKSLLRVLTHDILNPLMIIKHYNSVLKKELLEDKDHQDFIDHIKKIDKSLEALFMIESIASQVKSIEALDSGKESLTLSKINLYDALVEVQDLFKLKLVEKNIHLEISKDLKDIYVLANKTALIHQVLSNIISNAIKFSIRDSKIDVIKSHLDSDLISITIRDYGVGIPKSLIKDIFNPSAKTSTKGTMGEKGTGFGMPIVKEYMSAFYGDIEIDSIINKENKLEGSGTSVKLTFKR